jgi:hypothetical protein
MKDKIVGRTKKVGGGGEDVEADKSNEIYQGGGGGESKKKVESVTSWNSIVTGLLHRSGVSLDPLPYCTSP